MDFENAKTVKQCVEIATMDAYGDEELTTGWLNCLDEIFDDVDSVFVFGEEVRFKKFDELGGYAIVAFCERNKKKAKVSLDSIDTSTLSKSQKLWLKAYISWSTH